MTHNLWIIIYVKHEALLDNYNNHYNRCSKNSWQVTLLGSMLSVTVCLWLCTLIWPWKAVSYNNRYILCMFVRLSYLINGIVCIWTTSEVLATINVINRLVHSEIKLIKSTDNIFSIYLKRPLIETSNPLYLEYQRLTILIPLKWNIMFGKHCLHISWWRYRAIEVPNAYVCWTLTWVS